MVLHIGFIMDGNRRYAKEMGLEKFEGHLAGLKKMMQVIKWQIKYNIYETTFFALSTDNLKKRDSEELFGILKLIKQFKDDKEFIDYLFQMQVSIKFKGDMEGLKNSEKIKDYYDVLDLGSFFYRKFFLNYEKGYFKDFGILVDLNEKNSNVKKMDLFFDFLLNSNYVLGDFANPKHIVNICVNYGGIDEICTTFKNMIQEVKSGNLKVEQINYDDLKKCSYFYDSSPLDIIVRTGDAFRLSGFMLLHSAYSEMYFSSKMWPEFDEEDLKQVLNLSLNTVKNFGK